MDAHTRVCRALSIRVDSDLKEFQGEIMSLLEQEGRVYSHHLTFNKPPIEGRNYAIWLEPFPWSSFRLFQDVYGDTEIGGLIILADLILMERSRDA